MATLNSRDVARSSPTPNFVLATKFGLSEHMAMRLTIRHTPLKRLLGMQPKKARAIRDHLEKIAANPRAKNRNLKPLAGVPNGFRLRVGDWSISFTLDTQAGVMEVFEVEPRGGAY
jgi:mRNA-degrading endonuclease RelE of RelBE toxin-antitoxin system